MIANRCLFSALLAIALANCLPASEAAALAVLSSKAGLHEKARACQQLGVVGGPDSIPALAALLDEPHLSDYARNGLENIRDPAAGAALLHAMPKLNGLRLAGAVNSLGVRRDAGAVPELRKLALDAKRGVRAEAISSLGMIGTPEAVETIGGILTDGPAELRIPAAHAAFVAARHLDQSGDSAAAKTLLNKVSNAKLSEKLTTVADRLTSTINGSPSPTSPKNE